MCVCVCVFFFFVGGGGGGGLLPYLAYTGMCRWTGYGPEQAI